MSTFQCHLLIGAYVTLATLLMSWSLFSFIPWSLVFIPSFFFGYFFVPLSHTVLFPCLLVPVSLPFLHHNLAHFLLYPDLKMILSLFISLPPPFSSLSWDQTEDEVMAMALAASMNLEPSHPPPAAATSRSHPSQVRWGHASTSFWTHCSFVFNTVCWNNIICLSPYAITVPTQQLSWCSTQMCSWVLSSLNVSWQIDKSKNRKKVLVLVTYWK